MKTLIVYQSYHHGNTKKLIDAIAEEHEVDIAEIGSAFRVNLDDYDVIGLAAGIAYGKFYRPVENFAREKLPAGKKIFLLYTCGKDFDFYTDTIKQSIANRGCTLLGAYGCQGYDTYGPFKLIGGLAKGHPTEEEIQAAVAFYEGILNKAKEI